MEMHFTNEPTSERRAFLKNSAVATVAIPLVSQWSQARDADPIAIGIIGVGGMGMSHLKQLARRTDTSIAYVCDVDRIRLQNALKTVQEISGKSPKAVTDLREILSDEKVQAVFIATPDHWHAPAAILSLNAGKHVYVEKPCCHNLREGQLLQDAVEKSGKVLQVGTQSRSTGFVREAIDRLHRGAIGKILVAKAWNSQRRGSIGHEQPSDPPAELDFDTWLGPAEKVAYRKNLLHGVWRWWHDFGCGDMGNDGIHDIDVALWGLDTVRGVSKATNADIVAGRLSAAVVHLANIAARVGRVLSYDSATHKIIGDLEANRLVQRKYRDGHWSIPSGA